jgi:hypothetical protein
LEAFREILIKNPPSLTGIGRRVQKILSPQQREFLGHFLVGVAASNGQIEKSERISLRNIYRSMGLSNLQLDDLLAKLTVKTEVPVVVQPAVPLPKGEPLPAREVEPSDQAVTLDMELVAQITRETMAVADMIGKAMGDLEEQGDSTEEEQIEATPVPGSVASGAVELSSTIVTSSSPLLFSETYEGLPMRYHDALKALLTKEIWSKGDFEGLARRYGLMPAGMMDEINSWADEKFGDYLIDDQEPYHVQKELLEGRP